MARCVSIFLCCLLLLAPWTTLFPQVRTGSPTGAPERPAVTSPQKRTAPKAVRKTRSGDPAVGKTASGKTVYEGSRGGFYYRTKAGNKIYVHDFVGAKIVGKTPDGWNIFEGPRGGHFYYNGRGDKIYVKR